MSENDPRFGYPIEFVKEHVLGCFEASKACALLPGKPHLYHVEFLKREDSAEIKNGSALPLDFYLQAHFSPCDEVSWYLHTRKDNVVYEGLVQVDEEFVADNEAGVIPDRREHVRLSTLYGAETGRSSSDAPNHGALPKERSSVPTTPEISTDTMTDTFGCYSCANPSKKVAHSRACKSRRRRFDKINKELNKWKRILDTGL